MGIQAVGDRFEKGEYFLAELIAAAKFFEKGIKLVEPKLTKQIDEKTTGKILIGTVAGDIHDLGKNIVIIVLKINGFEVYDLGVNVPIQTFVEKVKERNPDIVGISCLRTTSIEPMKKTIEELRRVESCPRCKIVIGGGIVSERVREYVGADYYGGHAIETVKILKTIVGHL
jgi:5-methyltetrahydrofolate--homocysteine methyltransferase